MRSSLQDEKFNSRVGRWARGAFVLAAVPAVVLAGCSSDDADDEPVVNSVPATETTSAQSGQPPTSGNEEVPGDDDNADTEGADPGQDNQTLDTPGATTPTPDPGGDGAGQNGDSGGANPDDQG